MIDHNSTEMPFLDHLEELRWRIIWSLLALVVCVGAAFAVLLGLLGVAAAAVGAAPGMVSMFFDDNGNMKTFMALGVLFAMPIVGAIIGLVGGKLASS